MLYSILQIQLFKFKNSKFKDLYFRFKFVNYVWCLNLWIRILVVQLFEFGRLNANKTKTSRFSTSLPYFSKIWKYSEWASKSFENTRFSRRKNQAKVLKTIGITTKILPREIDSNREENEKKRWREELNRAKKASLPCIKIEWTALNSHYSNW